MCSWLLLGNNPDNDDAEEEAEAEDIDVEVGLLLPFQVRTYVHPWVLLLRARVGN